MKKYQSAAIIAIGCLGFSAPAAQAAESPGPTQDGYEKFANSISYEEYQAGVRELQSLGLVESNGVVQPADGAGVRSPGGLYSGGGGTRPLGKARHVGDLFYSPSTTGHNGIWHTTKNVVEANPGSGVRSFVSESREMNKGTEKMEVRTSQAVRDAAGAWARDRVGSGYNYAFAVNKTYSAPYNCSQLVWAAYHRKGVNLDKNGGTGVYPRDVRDDGDTATYQKLT